MTANKRIALNVVVTYGRSLYALVLGLFSARWVLLALGHVDYGLYGVIGGLAVFVTFINGLFASAVGRFYAFSVGRAQKEGNEAEGLEDCRGWFSVAVIIHVCLAVGLVSVGYPIGNWAVRNFLTIPADRVLECVGVWRCVCVTCFITMVNVPFQAMYTAKQEIAELTIFSFVQTTLGFIFFYYMSTHPGSWLLPYAIGMTIIASTPRILMCTNALIRFSECRFRGKAAKEGYRYAKLLEFAGGRFISAFSVMMGYHGVTVIVNKYLGPVRNAAVSVATHVSHHCLTLSDSFSGALWPAITNAAGRGDLDQMRCLVFRTCSISTAAVVVFAVPLSIEAPEVLHLWLKEPPEGSSMLCAVILLTSIIESLTQGHWQAIFALGKIMRYQIAEAMSFLLMFFVAWGGIAMGLGLWGVVACFIVGKLTGMLVKLYYGRQLCQLSVRHWLAKVFTPLLLTVLASGVIGFIPRIMMEPSFLRVCISTVACELVILPLLWLGVLGKEDRAYLTERIRKALGRK